MAFDPGFDDFISTDTVKIFPAPDTSERKPARFGLWGDGVRRLGAATGGRVPVRIRGRDGWVAETALGGRSLLEYYFIDVGQGDGVLIKTPDFRHLLIDGGYPRSAQPTGKSAADFVDWKFAKDYGHTTIVLDAMISSHIDWDHFGGLNDILDVAQIDQMDAQTITVDAFYHSGLSYWKKGSGRELGPNKATPDGKRWFTRVLDDRPSAEASVGGGAAPQLSGEWGKLIQRVVNCRTAAGLPTAITRLNQDSGWLPGFGQGASLAIRVLGPLGRSLDGVPAVLRLDSQESQNTNGTSVLLRFDFGHTRVLMTGDLNARAHRELLTHYAGQEREFASDVAKSCHHGSEDVSYPFLNHVKAACTVISSGDAEGHDHPRPRVVAASGLSGYVTLDGDELITPLVYSTELARSIQIGHLTEILANGVVRKDAALKADRLTFKVTAPGGFGARTQSAPAAGARVMAKLIYGLVNVRTDGERILVATMNEGDGSFSAKTFPARF